MVRFPELPEPTPPVRDVARTEPYVPIGKDQDLPTASPRPPTGPGTGADAPGLPDAVAPLESHTRFGKYELIRELGRGGMGAVYQAYHPGLRKHFALKILVSGPRASGDHAARLQREAQALARLSHPGIVAVYDVGEEEGRLYLAMEYVDGESLDRRVAAGPVPSAEAAAIVRRIAIAVQAAHDAGVLHRDLKPANILQDREGALKVSDFGLAKIEDPVQLGTTRTGAIMGTPPYLSPEHVEQGMRAVDAQSDVYQLGVVLYELLTGQRPYEGDSSTEILLRIARQDPPPPRTRVAGIDAAVETICLKAMAREKSFRYRTARDLAEDCRRFAEGEAILARPEPGHARAWRWVRRRKALAAAVAAAVVIASAAGGFAWRARVLEEEVLRALRDSARSSVDAVLMVRRVGGKLRLARETFVPPLEDAARRAIARAPRLAEPHYRVGRVYRALLRFDAALEEQSRALAKDPGHPGALYERAVLLAHFYGRRVAELRDARLARIGKARVTGQWFAALDGSPAGPDLPPDDELAAEDAEALRLRDAIRADLARLEAGWNAVGTSSVAPAGAEAISPGWLTALRGFALAYGTDADQARAAEFLREATDADPLLEEAWEARARLDIGRGAFPEAVVLLSRALEHDAGYVPFLLLRAETRRSLGLRRQAEGAAPEEEWNNAETDLAAAVAVDPEFADAWSARARLRFSWGVWLDSRTGAAGEKYALAIEDFGRAIALDSGSAERWHGRASVHMIRGLYQDRMGADPVASYRAAVEDFDRVLALAPGLVEAWLDRAETRNNWGVWLTRQRRDPGDLFTAAIADLGEAIRMAPDSPQGWLRRGNVRMNRGVGLEDGGDPAPSWDEAADDFEQAARRAPEAAEPLWRLGNLLSYRAGFASRHGGDPGPWFERALAALERAVRVDPREPLSWQTKANLESNWAGYQESRGGDGLSWLQEAEADCGRAIDLRPEDASMWITRGDLRCRIASVQARRAGNASDAWQAALEDYGRATELLPALDTAWLARGGLHHQMAIQSESRGEDPREHFQAARADLDRAVAASPSTGGARLRRAQMGIDQARSLHRRGENPNPLLELARADLDAELAERPGHPEVLRTRGVLHMNRGDWAAAVADLEAAEKSHPSPHPTFRRMLEDARRRLGERPR